MFHSDGQEPKAMKKHDNTLYLTRKDSEVHCEGRNLVIRHKSGELFRIPAHNIKSVINFGNVTWTSPAYSLCSQEGILITFLTEGGRFIAHVHGKNGGSVYLHRMQCKKTSTPETMVTFAKIIIAAKVSNYRTMFQRALRDHREKLDTELIKKTVKYLQLSLQYLEKADNLKVIRGIEGDAAKTAFAAFDQLIVAQKEVFFFKERSRRPPLDRVNALLSFLYTLLANDVASACEAAGLNSQMGFLHSDRSGRPSLALDLMEEFRPWIADRLAISMINRRQIRPDDFVTEDKAALVLTQTARNTVLKAWYDRKAEEMIHPVFHEKMTIGLIPLIQARSLARWIYGSTKQYQPLIWK